MKIIEFTVRLNHTIHCLKMFTTLQLILTKNIYIHISIYVLVLLVHLQSHLV